MASSDKKEKLKASCSTSSGSESSSFAGSDMDDSSHEKIVDYLGTERSSNTPKGSGDAYSKGLTRILGENFRCNTSSSLNDSYGVNNNSDLNCSRNVMASATGENGSNCIRYDTDEERRNEILRNEDHKITVNNAELFTSPVKSNRRGAGLPLELTGFREMHDLTKLDCITLENVLECLRERYRCHQYYTYAGPILLSLNSCRKLPRASIIEDITRMSWYYIKDSKSSHQNENENVQLSTSPHAYDIGKQCIKNLVTVGSHQIVLVSGESGAGKTTATQQLIKYLTENNSRNFGANVCSNLDKKIYYATLILESFGNAKTQQNPNSSRFGRLVQLNYQQNSGEISGAEIHTYLLEKHRVAKYDFRCERSFHIFYHILLGLKNSSLNLLDSLTWDTFKHFIPNHLIIEASECDDDDFQRLQNAVQVFNMDDEFCKISTLLLALISLLNVTFVPDCDSSSEDEHFSSSCESPYKTEFTVSEWSCAQTAANLLGIKDTELVDILIARKITAGHSTRHSIFRKPCERATECEERLHALTSFIYDRIFSYVLEYLNTSLKGYCCVDVDDIGHSTISLLDLYGFENFSSNHLEQICINYANERLQQINVSIVKSYYEQSIPADEVCIPPTELIKIEDELHQRINELHLHVFSFLDEECLLKRLSEDKHVLERMSMNLSSKNSQFIRCGKPHERVKFVVSHYATQVEYQLSGMVQKNKDHIPPEFQDILKCSSDPFVHNLFKFDLIRSRNASGATPKSVFTVSSNKNTRGKTILTRFRTSVEELMNKLKKTENNDIHFIRCIRPNADLLAGTFSSNLVEKQLHACGIADVVKIAGNGYPIRVHVSKFQKEFPNVILYFCAGSLNSRLISLVFSQYPNVRPMKFGKSLVFMSEESWKMLRNVEKFLTVHNARIIQRAWRRFQERKELLKSSTNQQFSLNNTSISFFDNSLGTDVDQASHCSYSTSESGIVSENSVVLDVSRPSSQYQQNTIQSKLRRINSISLPLYCGDGIISRSPIHSLPIKLYMKKTCLSSIEKPPRRLISNGISDAFEDYGIIYYKTQLKTE